MQNQQDYLVSYPGSSGPLARRCRECFGDRVCHKAQGYLAAGWVAKPAVSGKRISGHITGLYVGKVDLVWGLNGDDELFAACACPQYKRGTLCEHIWAMILKVDQVGLGSSVPGNGKLLVFQLGDVGDDELALVDVELDRVHKASKPVEKAWLNKIKALQERRPGVTPKNSNRLSLRGGKARAAFFALNLDSSREIAQIVVELLYREKLMGGGLGIIKYDRVSKEDLALYEDPKDRDIMAKLLLNGISPQGRTYSSGGYSSPTETTFYRATLPPDFQEEMIRELCETGRFGLLNDGQSGKREILPLAFDDQAPWRFELVVNAETDHYKIGGRLFRKTAAGDERIPIEVPKLLLSTGLVIFPTQVARLEAREQFSWISSIRASEFLKIPLSDGQELLEVLGQDPNSPPVEWPAQLQWPKESLSPLPQAVIKWSDSHYTPGLNLGIKFSYAEHEIFFGNASSTILDKEQKRVIVRNLAEENGFLEKLKSLKSVEPVTGENGEASFRIIPTEFPSLVSSLLEWGWKVEAHGKKVRSSGEFNMGVTSGVDWFDIHGDVKFDGGLSLALPKLLAAIERRDNLVALGDGTFGMLPSAWLERYAPLAKLGRQVEEGLRFTRGQGALLAAWLEEENLSSDLDFSKLMKALKSRTSLKPLSPLPTFRGELRPYQKEGLAWLGFLRETGLGGILADDMGLGKTVQVLAHLQAEYASMTKETHKPTLIVVPKSLLFNWRDEGARFAPNLKVMIYAGSDRHHLLKEFKSTDIILVTYSTMRLDIEEFRRHDFHYVISDEAQAIKNATSQSHMACCLLRAKHKLAMTGTPVENSVDDLISILDFVSPGLLGENVRNRLSSAATQGRIDSKVLSQLSKALRPFILRRTKDQVLKDLPDKTEKVLHCELSTQEMRAYVELREHYRAHLAGEVKRRGLSRSKIVILEALLRLRQAACHPGLIDKKRMGAPSAKVEALIAQIRSVTSEGHKALVFSQFTTFLDIVGLALKKEKIAFERLDGKTPHLKRRDMVHRFQTESASHVFLISLKAGGVGLNLTAADYVFILDPWWNPAVESQAIDRSHRIGQKNKVIAYKLIAKNTVEEKIIELQKQKREVADAIISADASLLKKLTAKDVEMLLS